MNAQNRTLNVKGTSIRVINRHGSDYVSLTDMLKSKDGDFFIADWLRNRNTVEFLGVWETVNNLRFNSGEFAIIKTSAGLNSFKISAKEWISKTGAIGIISSAGRYGGTYAHIDIALEFGMWISAEFKVYLIKEVRRLKDEESGRLGQEWSITRMLAKVNYKIHTDAIRDHLIPAELNRSQISAIYASEADLLNMALFGMTAKQWREANPVLKGNLRDNATIEQLVVLSNLESMNAAFILDQISQAERLFKLNRLAIGQMKSLLAMDFAENNVLRVEEEWAEYRTAS